MSLWSYSPSDVIVLVGGTYQVEGYVEGSFVEIEKVEAPYRSRRTPDGTVARMHTKSADYIVALRVMSMSPSNNLLTKLWQLDEITKVAKFPLLIKDTSGSGLFYSPTTWVEKLPTLSYSNQPSERVWGLKSAGGILNVGGNDDPSSLAEDIANILSGAIVNEGLF